MAIDWPEFLDEHGISYSTSSRYVTRGNIGVPCPFCTEDDGFHLGISLTGKGWRCWRDARHKGRGPVRLISALLGVSYERAREMVGLGQSIPADFLGKLQALLGPREGAARSASRAGLAFPKEFREFQSKPSAKPYERYLRERGFDNSMITHLSHDYGMSYCVEGSYRGRVIFPVYEDGLLKSWTGRSITDNPLRYKTLSADPEKAKREGYEPAIAAINQYLLFQDRINEGDCETICVVEGPMDAAKVITLGERHGILSTCFFTQMPTDQQIGLLHEVLPKYQHRYLMLDRGTLAKALFIQAQLASLRLSIISLPPGLKDPGEISTEAELFSLFQT